MAVAKILWKALAVTSGMLAARATKAALDKGWRKKVGDEPPRNPAAPGTDWKEAVVWAAASGTALALAKVAATNGAAKVWQKTTGNLPPGVEEVGA
ncbi:MAG: hypothetical protein JWN87_1963 [Frankiales bacterium]|jgi:hypothetical protein|nr:hypothetical protein [Frankiales bacterium]MCW2584927.1 hypothetical protein [Frankiales bacterium]